MANLNKVMLIGRLTRDPETRATQGGASLCKFGLAVNRKYTRKGTEEAVEETTFVDVEAWGKTGEVFARYVRKGSQVYVEGRLRLDRWEKDGQKHSKLGVVMENFQFLDSRGSGGGGGGEAGGADEASSRRRAPAQAPAAAGTTEETPQDDYAAFDQDIPF